MVCFFFFKQKTAYEITYGDWSSDVCSSDLPARRGAFGAGRDRAGERVDPGGRDAHARPHGRRCMNAGADTHVVVARDVTKTYATAGGPFIALDRVSFDVRQGKFVAIIGPGGCGKSTLLQIVGGLAAATSG